MSSNVTTRSRRRLITRKTSDDEKENMNVIDVQSSKPSKNVEIILKEFLSAASKIDIFATQSNLAKAIADASINFDNKGNVSLVVAENASDLLSICRTLLKNADNRNELCVALHTIRALYGVVAPNKIDTLVKLLYHLIVAGERHSCMDIVLLTFDTLEKVLQSLTTQEGNVKIVVQAKDNALFPTPRMTKSKQKPTGSMPLQELTTIVVKAIVSLGGMLIKWSRNEKEFRRLMQKGGYSLPINDVESARETAMQLLTVIATEWILFTINQSGDESFISLNKCLFRVVWEVAAGENDAGKALLLRGQAIQTLLLGCGKLTDTTKRLITEKLFETGCTNAWKAAVLFFKQKGKSALLDQFHSSVGNVLDSYAMEQNHTLQYVQYAAYRALHMKDIRKPNACADPECPFQSLPYTFVHIEHTNIHSSFMLVYLLAIHCMRLLEDSSVSSMNGSIVEYAITEFSSHFDCKAFAGDERYLMFKLFVSLSLHRFLFTWNDLVNTLSDRQKSSLGYLAQISTNCIGPFASAMLRDGYVEKEKAQEVWEILVESYLRGIVTLDCLSDSETPKVDALISDLVHICTSRTIRPDIPVSCLEKVAKSLAIVGRRRYERSDNICSVAPLLSSIRLFTAFANSSERTKFSGLQLSSRWLHLATLYQSMGKNEEAVLSTISGLVYNAFEDACRGEKNPGESDNIMFELLAYLSRKIKYFLCCTVNDQKNNVVHKLSQLCWVPHSRSVPSGKPRSLTASMALEALSCESHGFPDTATFVEERGCIPFHIAPLLQIMLSSGCKYPPEKYIDPELSLLHKLKLLIEIIQSIGPTISSIDDVEVNFKLSQYNHIVVLASSFIQRLENEHAKGCIQSILASLYIVASMALLPTHFRDVLVKPDIGYDVKSIIESREEKILQFVRKYASKARLCLAEENEISFGRSLPVSMCAILVDVYCSKIDSLSVFSTSLTDELKVDAQDDIQQLALQLKSNDVLAQFLPVVEDVITVLAIQCYRMAFTGEKLRATQISAISLDLATRFKLPISEICEITFLSIYYDAGFISTSGEQREKINEGRSWLFYESQACILRLLLQSTTPCNDISERLGKLLVVIRDQSFQDQPIEAFCWPLSTILMTMAEKHLLCGRLLDALAYFKACARECQSLISSLRKSNAESNNNDFLADISFFAPMRCFERQSICLQRISHLYSKLGDYRKAEQYAILAHPQENGLDITSLINKGGAKSDLNDTFRTLYVNSRNPTNVFYSYRRLIVELHTKSTAVDRVSAILDDIVVSQESTPQVNTCPSLFPTLNISIEAIQDSLHVQVLAEHTLSFRPTVADLYPSRRTSVIDKIASSYNQLVTDPQYSAIIKSLNETCIPPVPIILPQIKYRLKLLETMSHIVPLQNSRNSVDEDMNNDCEEVANSQFATSEDRAKAYYSLGLRELARAKVNDELRMLWESEISCPCKQKDESFMRSIRSARRYFHSALDFLGQGSDQMTRDVLRCLSLVSGPGHRASLYLHLSLNVTMRRKISLSLKQDDGYGDVLPFQTWDSSRPPTNEVIFRLFENWINHESDSHETCFSEILEDYWPSAWPVVAAALCPTGDILLSRMQVGIQNEVEFHTICIFSPLDDENCSRPDLYDEIVKPLDEIIRDSQNQLQGADSGSRDDTNGDQRKREWWSHRNRINQQLEELLDRVDEILFSSNDAQAVLRGEHRSCNLASKFEAVTQDSVNVAGPTRIESSITERRWRNSPCTFLILDENLSRFPFEGLPSLQGQTISRLPGIPFGVASLIEQLETENGEPVSDPSRVSYVLDPESNLSGTRTRLEPFLNDLNSSNGQNWRAVIGKAPDADFMEKSITQENGLVLFFGHGGGQSFYSRQQVESLNVCSNDSSFSVRRARSPLVLMGCSSAKTESINRKESTSLDRLPLYYEPEGIILTYLFAGVPSVVGNLWDVTDRDIDRFTIAFLSDFFKYENQSLAECVSKARSACKMKFIVGCAPVHYGIPFHCLRK